MSQYPEVFTQVVIDECRDVNLSEAADFCRQHAQLSIAEIFTDYFLKYRQGIKLPERKIDSLVDKFWELVSFLEMARSPDVFPGAIEIIKKLHTNGFCLFLSSGAETGILTRRLKKAGLENCFREALGSEVISKGLKDGKAHLYFFARLLGVRFEDFCRKAILVGDWLFDMQTASKFSLYGIGITNTVSGEVLKQAGAKAVVSSFSALEEHIKMITS